MTRTQAAQGGPAGPVPSLAAPGAALHLPLAPAAAKGAAHGAPPGPDGTPDRPSIPKLGNVQALRAIAVLMVVAVHVGNPFGFAPRYLGSDALTWVDLPGQAGVDLFFVISGLIMTVTTWGSASGPSAARRFMSRRARRIYPIYWVVSLLVLAVYLVSPSIVNSHSSHAPEVLQSFTLLPQPGVPLLGVGWTLTYEMYFYLVFALALALGRKRLPWVLGAWGAITLVLAVLFSGTHAPLLHLVSNPLSLEFVLGVVVGFLVMTRPPVAPGLTLAAGGILFVVAIAFAGRIYPVELDSWYRAAAVGPPAAMMLLGAIGLERRRRFVAPRSVQFVGDASYSIYLWHTLLLVAAGRAIATVLPSAGGALRVALLIAVPIAVVAASIVLYRLVEVPLNARLHRRAPRPQAQQTA